MATTPYFFPCTFSSYPALPSGFFPAPHTAPAFPHAATVPYAPSASAYALAPDFSPSQFDFGAPAMVPISSAATATPSTSTPPAPLRELPEPQPALWPPPPPLTPFPTPPAAFPYAAAYAHPPPVAASAYTAVPAPAYEPPIFFPTTAPAYGFSPVPPFPYPPPFPYTTPTYAATYPHPASAPPAHHYPPELPMQPESTELRLELGPVAIQPRRPPPSSPPPLAASVPAVQEGAAPSTSSSGRLHDSPWTTSAPAAALIVLCSSSGPERRPSSPSSAPVPAPSATRARRPTPPPHQPSDFMCQGSKTEENGNSTAALSRPPLDCLHANVFDCTTEVTTTASASVGYGYYVSSTSTGPTLGKVASAPSIVSNTGAAASSSASSRSPPFGASATAYVAPQVFGEMPTQSSCHGTDATTPNYCSGHQTRILSSCMQGGSTNLSEQYLDGIPQPYGFHNLNRRSLSLADGNQRSYYALPENYSLLLATSSMSPATSTIEVSDSYQFFPPPVNDLVSEKQTHLSQKSQSTLDILAQVKAKVEAINEKLKNGTVGHSCEMILDRTEQKAASEPLLTRETINEFNEMPIYDVYDETEDCLNESVDVQQLYEEEQQETEQSPKCSKANTTACYDSLLVRDLQLPTAAQDDHNGFKEMPQYDVNEDEQTICALEKLNDNENLSLAKQDNDQLLQCFSNVHETEQTSADMLDYTFEKQQQNDEKASGNVQQLRDPQLNALVIHERRKEWDPGDTQFQVLFTAAAGTTKMQCTNACTSVMLQVLDVQFNARRALNSESDVLCYLAYGLRGTELNAAVLLVLAVKCSPGKAKLQWDPGIAISFCMDSWLEMTAVKTLARLQRTLLTYWQCQLPMRKNSCSEHKFLSQQGLQKKYNTKNLLSSQNYLQIWEMDIIFTTFLPP